MNACLPSSALCCLLLASCSLLEQSLRSESGLYEVPLERNGKAAVDGLWLWGKGNPYAHKAEGYIYLAPLNISAVQAAYPEYAPLLAEQMHRLMADRMGAMLAEANEANHTRWALTEDASRADLHLELAVVKLRLQKPGLHIVAKASSHFTSDGVSDAIDYVSAGDIALEGAMRDGRTGELMLAFRDSNRAKLRFYHMDTYRRTGHVDANLRLWSQKLATLCRECACDRLGEGTLQEKLDKRPLSDVLKAHLN